MTDLEMVRLCAEAMGLTLYDDRWKGERFYLNPVIDGRERNTQYDPLHDDEQAMALVKKLLLNVRCYPDFVSGHKWIVTCTQSMQVDDEAYVKSDLNRAIVECVAKMQKAKEGK